LKTVADLSLMSVWVNPDHRVTSAKILLSGHELRAIAVVESGRLVGDVTAEALAAAPGDATVASVMLPPPEPLDLDDSLQAAATQMVRLGTDHLPVVSKGRYVGMVTSLMLLPEIGRTWDPLTGLHWSDELREWGAERLHEGKELTIVFIDLDDFGLFNKKYGHVVGDSILKGVAATLSEMIAPDSDLLVRFGGDEFVIGTVRPRNQVTELAQAVERALGELSAPGQEEPVAGSVGVFGGRRTHERENIHYGATLDNLINSASKAAQAAKAAKKPASQISRKDVAGPERTGEPPQDDVFVVDVGADDRTPGALTTVMLSRGERIVSGVHSRGGMTLIESVVHAAARALERLFPSAQIRPGEVRLTEDPSGAKAVSVSGQLTVAGAEDSFSAAGRVESDVYLTAAQVAVAGILSAGVWQPGNRNGV
jgi:IMP dehydrogenase